LRSRRPLDPASLKEEDGPGADQPGIEDFLEAVDEMRASGDFEWADDTLKGIYDWCKENRRFTNKQLVAVNNIRFTRHWDEINL
jgi:hypothetical protein